jgi:hypothetical protein
VPSTISTVSGAYRCLGRSASFGARSPMIRSAADFEVPNNAAIWRIVRLVRQ